MFRSLAAVVVVDPEVVPFDIFGEDVPGADQETVANGFAGPQLAAPASRSVVLGGKVSAL